MTNVPTAEEQLQLELMNRFRMDPDGEYLRLVGSGIQANVQSAIDQFNVDLTALRTQLAALNPVAPIAWNTNLAAAADYHNGWMIRADGQAHQFPGEPDLGVRATNAGYQWSRLGENVYAYAQDMVFAHAGFVIDWGAEGPGGDGIQDGAGHRANIMSANYTEVGVAVSRETNSATQVGPYVITQDFGTSRNYKPQFLGVVIDDRDNDDFYDIGEGLGGVTITLKGAAGTFTTTSWAAGGWQIVVPAGTYNITFSGGGLDAPITKSATLGAQNVKLDVEDGDASVVVGPTAGNDVLDGTAAGDTIAALAGHDTIRGHGGNDLLHGNEGDDLLYGGLGADFLDGGIGFDRMWGEAGDDIYVVRAPNQQANELAGQGIDHVRAWASYNLGANVENATAMMGGLTIGGNILANSLTGSAGNDILVGYGGNDTASGGGGDDVLYGNDGADVLFGGSGADLLDGGAGLDRMSGGAGNDTFIVRASNQQANEVAGEGVDQVRAWASYNLGANVENATAMTGGLSIGGNMLANALTGSAGGDILAGYGGNDAVFGGGGNDVLYGNDGADLLYGGVGADLLDGGIGLDRMWGGGGDDTYVVRATNQQANEVAGEGIDQVRAWASYTLGANVENATAMAAGLSVAGNALANVLIGSAGADVLLGNAGEDTLVGAGGVDFLRGGLGMDAMSGGLGGDQFRFDDGEAGASAALADRITDFSRAQADKIDLTMIDAAPGTIADNSFTFIGARAFGGRAGELRYAKDAGGFTMIMADQNGDKVADLFIRVNGLVDLQATDFVL